MQYSPTSGELQVYFSLATFVNRFGFCAVKLQTLAERAGVSVATVACAKEGLERKGLISIKNRYNFDGDRIANGYFLTPIGDKFPLVDSSVLQYNLPKIVLKVYIYDL